MWPGGSVEPKEIELCPICGREKPGAEEGDIDWTQPDEGRDEFGYLICDGDEEHEPVRFESFKVMPYQEGWTVTFTDDEVDAILRHGEAAHDHGAHRDGPCYGCLDFDVRKKLKNFRRERAKLGA